MNIHPHLIFAGRCQEAFQRYAALLGGEIVFCLTYGQTPAGAQTAPDWRAKIAHARLQIGSQVILGADAPPDRYRPPGGFGLMIGVDDPARATSLFNALAEQGEIGMPLQETFWSHRFGMCKDQFGIPWMINCEKPLEQVANAGRDSAR